MSCLQPFLYIRKREVYMVPRRTQSKHRQKGRKEQSLHAHGLITNSPKVVMAEFEAKLERCTLKGTSWSPLKSVTKRMCKERSPTLTTKPHHAKK